MIGTFQHVTVHLSLERVLHLGGGSRKFDELFSSPYSAYLKALLLQPGCHLGDIGGGGAETCPELFRLKGEMLAQSGDSRANGGSSALHDEVRACFREAVSVAKQQKSKGWEARVKTSMAKAGASK